MSIFHSLSSFAPARLICYKFESGPEAPSVAAEQGLDDKPDKQQEGNAELDKTEEKIIRDAVTEAIIAQGDKSYKILLSPAEAGLESDDALKAAIKAGTVEGVYYSNGKLNPSRVWVPATVKNRLQQQEKLWKSQDQMKKERDYGVTDSSHFQAEEAHATDLRAKLSGPRMKSAQQRADEREIRSLERVLRRGEAKKKKGLKTKKSSEKTATRIEEVNSTAIKNTPEVKPILEPETVTPPEPVPKTKAEPVPVAETDPQTVAITPPSTPSTPEPEVEIETKSEPNTEIPKDDQKADETVEEITPTAKQEEAPTPEVKPKQPSMPILGSSEANEEPEYGYFEGMGLNVNHQTLLIDYAKENQLTGPNGELTREEQQVIVNTLSGFIINESLLNAQENPAVLSMVQDALVNHRSNQSISLPDEAKTTSSESTAVESPNAGVEGVIQENSLEAVETDTISPPSTKTESSYPNDEALWIGNLSPAKKEWFNALNPEEQREQLNLMAVELDNASLAVEGELAKVNRANSLKPDEISKNIAPVAADVLEKGGPSAPQELDEMDPLVAATLGTDELLNSTASIPSATIVNIPAQSLDRVPQKEKAGANFSQKIEEPSKVGPDTTQEEPILKEPEPLEKASDETRMPQENISDSPPQSGEKPKTKFKPIDLTTGLEKNTNLLSGLGANEAPHSNIEAPVFVDVYPLTTMEWNEWEGKTNLNIKERQVILDRVRAYEAAKEKVTDPDLKYYIGLKGTMDSDRFNQILSERPEQRKKWEAWVGNIVSHPEKYLPKQIKNLEDEAYT